MMVNNAKNPFFGLKAHIPQINAFANLGDIHCFWGTRRSGSPQGFKTLFNQQHPLGVIHGTSLDAVEVGA